MVSKRLRSSMADQPTTPTSILADGSCSSNSKFVPISFSHLISVKLNSNTHPDLETTRFCSYLGGINYCSIFNQI